MAEAAVSFLLEKIDNELSKALSLPESNKAGIKKLTSELEVMTEVLKAADARGEGDNENKVWIQKFRHIAYEIEEVVDEVAYKIYQENAPWYSRARWSRTGEHLIATSIEKIETMLKSIKDQMERYQTFISSHNQASTSSGNFHPGIAPLFTSDAEIVGVEEPRKKPASWVLDVEQAYKVMFVVGMGGSGKTALVKLVFDQLKVDFNCHVWLTASKHVKPLELLSIMYSKLSNQTVEESTPFSTSFAYLHDLTLRIRNYLQNKRYLIVIDDLWIRDVWEKYLKYALPEDNCSRVIITTRRGDIASSCRENNYVDIYNLPALPREKAQQLFYKKAFPQSGKCTSAPELCSRYENLLAKCEGLPLGIIEIGKYVSNREQSESELRTLNDNLQTELKSSALSSIYEVLLLSYNDLPYYLKYCFLYTSMFPEHYVVKRRTLIRLWIAEGFIKGENGKQLEDVGEGYLKELIERNLIQACEIDFNGRPITCRVHNLMHKIVILKSEEENFSATYTNKRDISVKGPLRRLSIENGEFDMSNIILPHTRTLLTSKLYLKIPPRLNSSFKLLKILHLNGALLDAFPKGIDELLLLKYLCLSNTKIKLVPMSIGRLQRLETLNLKQTFVTTLPSTMAKLKKLRHLLVSRYNIESYIGFDAVQGFKVQFDVSKLTSLQKLSFARADKDHKLIKEMQNLTQIRKLGIVDLPRNGGPVLCQTITMLENLQSLNVTSLHRDEVLDIQEITCPPRFLQRLYLKGRLEKIPHWISKLHDLVRIRLKWTRLTSTNNPITFLEDLPNLLELQLLDAYTGDQLNFKSGKFLKLNILEFELMENLRNVEIGNGALTCLRKLIIKKCENLRKIPHGIHNLIQLEELHLNDLPPDFVNPLRINGGMHHLVQHIQRIYCVRLHNGNWEVEDLS